MFDLEQRYFISHLTGKPVQVETATDEEFDEFIRQYIAMQWSTLDRIDALVDAILDDQPIAFVEPEKLSESGENTQFFKASETAGEADLVEENNG